MAEEIPKPPRWFPSFLIQPARLSSLRSRMNIQDASFSVASSPTKQKFRLAYPYAALTLFAPLFLARAYTMIFDPKKLQEKRKKN